MSFEIRVEGEDAVFPCREDQTVLAALAPIHHRKIVSGCRSGGCGVCKITILEGAVVCGRMSAAHVDGQQTFLACRARARSNLVIRVAPR